MTLLFVQFILFCSLMWHNCSSLTFVTIGMGNVGKRITKLALENGLKCVGGVTRTSNLGKDIGTVIGEDEIGVKITSSNNLSKLLLTHKVNIIFEATTTMLNMNGHYTLFKSILDLSTKENNPNGDYFNIITVESSFYYPFKSYSIIAKEYVDMVKINELNRISKSKQIGIIGTGVQDLFVHSLLPSLLPLVPNFNTIKIQYSFNANHPYYSAYVSGINIDTYDSCNSFISKYFPVFNEQIVYRIIGDTLNMDLEGLDNNNQAIMELSECSSLFNYDEKVLCVGCDKDNKLYYIEPGLSIGVNTTFSVNIKLKNSEYYVVSVSSLFGVFDNFNAMTVDYNIIGPYNHQSISTGHIDDYIVTANSAIQRINDVMNGKGIITDNLPFIQYYKGHSNYPKLTQNAYKNEL
eukprot:117302_1